MAFCQSSNLKGWPIHLPLLWRQNRSMNSIGALAASKSKTHGSRGFSNSTTSFWYCCLTRFETTISPDWIFSQYARM